MGGGGGGSNVINYKGSYKRETRGQSQRKRCDDRSRVGMMWSHKPRHAGNL